MALAVGIRPDPKLTKLLYKAMKTPKGLRENDKNFTEKQVTAWSKDSFPFQRETE